MWYELAIGSIVGTNHLRSGPPLRRVLIGKPNQDAISVVETDGCVIAIICDGCSDATNSSHGAFLQACLLSRTIDEMLTRAKRNATSITLDNPKLFLDRVLDDILAELRVIGNSLSLEFGNLVRDTFLATTIGIISTVEHTIIFSLGDGIYVVNGTITKLGPFANNAPAYLGYRLLGSTSLTFTINVDMSTSDVTSLLIGTDGVQYLVDSADKLIPGTSTVVGNLDQLWTDSRFFENENALELWLRCVNRDTLSIAWDTRKVVVTNGLLPDDATIFVLRRKR